MSTTETDTKAYTQLDVQTILSNLRATTSDYLILTYFRIHKITSGHLYNKYKRRFNNIIFPEVTLITKSLTDTVFLPKCFEVLWRDLSTPHYISFIYSKPKRNLAPIIIQFFDKCKGIEYRQLDCKYAPSSLPTILSQNRIIDKTVAYCGDYCQRDPGNVNRSSCHVTNLRLLSGNNVLNLPSCDGFVNLLFDVLLDYLPEDVVKPLIMLGEVILNSTDDSAVARNLANMYKQWRESGHHILISGYVDYVTRYYLIVNYYLQPLQYLPYCFETLFSSVQQRFLLVFMKELYRKVQEHQLSDNNAVVYYFHLRKIQDTFRRCQDGDFPLSEPWNYLNDEIETLKQRKQFKSPDDDVNLQELCKKVMLIIDTTYTRGLMYLEPLLQQFEGFDVHSWLLLSDLPLQWTSVHASYHHVKQRTCEKCDELRQEAKLINGRIEKVPLLEVESVVAKWVLILKECTVPMIEDLLEYLFSLPASYKMAQNEDHEECAEHTIRVNFRGVQDVEVVENVEVFFDGYLEEARGIIQRNQTPLFVD